MNVKRCRVLGMRPSSPRACASSERLLPRCKVRISSDALTFPILMEPATRKKCRHARDTSCPRRGGIAGQCLDAPRGQAGHIEMVDTQGTKLCQSVQGIHHGWRTDACRSTTQPVQRRYAIAISDHEQRLQPTPLVRTWKRCQNTPQSSGCSIAHPEQPAVSEW